MRSGVASIIRCLLLLLVAVELANSIGVAGTRSGAVALVSKIRDTEAALEKIQLPNPSEDLPYDVPNAARPLLTEIKHQLRDLILSTLDEAKGVSGERLRAGVLAELDRAGVRAGRKNIPKSQYYGGIVNIEIKQPAGHNDLLAATTTLQIPCGDGDTSLYIFKRGVAGWNSVIAFESDNYRQVNGAQGQFKYAVSPSDPEGHWYVVTAEIPPWCTSCWGGLHYEVLRPGATPDSPIVLLKGEKGIYRCAEPPYKLAMEPGGFGITYVAMNWLDAGGLTAFQVNRFSVEGDHVRQIAPLAFTPQDFINAWLQLSWNDAARWVNPLNASSFKKWHSQLQPKTSGEYIEDGEVDFVQPCDKPATRWLVGMSDEFKEPKRFLFFTVSKRRGIYHLDSIDTVHPPGCPGNASPINISGWKSLGEQLSR
jgi:hypothetical protein